MQHQAVGRCEQYFEEHEQVEQVSGQERTVQPHELDLEQRVEAGTGPVPASQREQQGADTDDPGQHQHHRRQVVHHQHDAERHAPVARQVDTDRAAAAAVLYPEKQHHGNAQPEDAGKQIDTALERPVLFTQPEHQPGGQQRQQDGRDDQLVHPAHALGSRPSTWSVPVRPLEASKTTRNSAVMAKLMTIAVSTSACGNGSV